VVRQIKGKTSFVQSPEIEKEKIPQDQICFKKGDRLFGTRGGEGEVRNAYGKPVSLIIGKVRSLQSIEKGWREKEGNHLGHFSRGGIPIRTKKSGVSVRACLEST